MGEEDVKDLLFCVVEKQPGVIFDILDKITLPGMPQGYHPQPGDSVPAWCMCSRCREMPTLPERVCCAQVPDNCISQLPVSVMNCQQCVYYLL